MIEGHHMNLQIHTCIYIVKKKLKKKQSKVTGNSFFFKIILKILIKIQ